MAESSPTTSPLDANPCSRHLDARAEPTAANYASYGMSTRFNGSTGDGDHLVSLELGRSNSRANLFPEAASPRPGSHENDRLENPLHTEVCSAQLTLRQAQKLIAGDWLAAYRGRFR
jgi:hypothetical protein